MAALAIVSELALGCRAPVGVMTTSTPALHGKAVSGGAQLLREYSGSDAAMLKLKRQHMYSAQDLNSPVVIPAESSWNTTLPTSDVLNLYAARIDWPDVAGADPAMEVHVNGTEVTVPLANKGASFQYADGRVFPYFTGSAWQVFYSPDFTLNNTPSSGGYQVISDPGQAYRYQWVLPSDLFGLSGATMSLRIYNNGSALGAPIVVQLDQPPPIKLSLQFGDKSVTPLADKQTSQDDASTTTLTVSVTQGGKPLHTGVRRRRSRCSSTLLPTGRRSLATT